MALTHYKINYSGFGLQPEHFVVIRARSAADLTLRSAARWCSEKSRKYVKDPSQHGGVHYEVYRNMRDFEKGIRDYQVWADGTVGRSYR